MRIGNLHLVVSAVVALSGLLCIQCSCEDEDEPGGGGGEAGVAGSTSGPLAGSAGEPSTAGAAGQPLTGGAAGQPSAGGAAGEPPSTAGAGGLAQGGAPGAGASGEGGASATAGAASTDCPLLSTVVDDPSIEKDTVIPEGCFVVSEDVFVSNQAFLKVSPGVTLKFEKDVALHVKSDGTLDAAGTSAKPILMTGTKSIRGHWGGVQFDNSASPSNVLDYVIIEYAGSEEILDAGARPLRAGLDLNSSGYEVRVRIQHTTLRQSSGYGLHVASEAVLPGFAHNELTDNASGAAYVYAPAVHQLTGSSSYDGNDEDFVFVNGAYEFGQDARTWQTLDVPYRVDGVFILETQLTLSAGTTLEFTEESWIDVEGDRAGITAIGTEEAPIVFTGVTKEPGGWGGLYLTNTDDEDPGEPRSQLEYVTVEYGGSNEFLDDDAATVRGNITLDSSGWPPAISLRHSTIAHSLGYGVWLDCTAFFNASDNTYSDNAWADQRREPCD
jgi:hypothetical protein